MGYVINLLNFPIIAKKSSFSFVPLPMKLGITSYGLARRDKKELSRVRWFLLVIDEAQNIKNPNSEQTKAIKAIRAKNKIAMSGTPVENRLLEYWSIFDFTNKYYLGTPNTNIRYWEDKWDML
ncbi:MAG: SNF2-related protein [Wolbachia sp.]